MLLNSMNIEHTITQGKREVVNLKRFVIVITIIA